MYHEMFPYPKKSADILLLELIAIYCHTRPSTSIIALSRHFLNASQVFKNKVYFKHPILELAKL